MLLTVAAETGFLWKQLLAALRTLRTDFRKRHVSLRKVSLLSAHLLNTRYVLRIHFTAAKAYCDNATTPSEERL